MCMWTFIHSGEGFHLAIQSNRSEVMWAAGLFEGEGCISSWRRKDTHTPQLTMNLTSTDEDVVRRFHGIVGIGTVTGPHDRGHKPTWSWRASGFPSAQAVVAMLWDGLGIRRKARAKELLLAGRGTGLRGTPGRRNYHPI